LRLLKLVLAVSEGRGEEAAGILDAMAVRLDDHDERAFVRGISDLVGRYQDAAISEASLGHVLMEMTRVAADNGYRPVSSLTMLGRTLAHLDEVTRELDPQFRPTAVVRERAQSVLRRHMLRSLSPGNVLGSTLEMNEFLQKLPSRLNRLLDSAASNDISIRVRAFDEARMMEGFQKVANRITLGLVLAALIVGAALLARVETSFTVLGYPGVPALLFALAAAFGFALVWQIWRRDEHRRKP
jgi:predicted unusual protein kinase regulating ubiquinone biosynthesis (AarF/ABC1/UbiB family)